MANSITNAQLAADLAVSLEKWQTFLNNLLTWETGAADGGTEGDGVYELITPAGQALRVKGLLKLIKDVDDLIDAANGAKTAAEAAQALAEIAQGIAEVAKDTTIVEANRAEQARDAAIAAQNEAANSRSICTNISEDILGVFPLNSSVNFIEASEEYNSISESDLGKNIVNVIHCSVPNSTVVLPHLIESYLINIQDAVEGGGNHTILQAQTL